MMLKKVIQAGTIKKITRIWVVQAETPENHLVLRQNKTKFCDARGGTVRDPVTCKLKIGLVPLRLRRVNSVTRLAGQSQVLCRLCKD